jgi:Undecaprenyl-phosphate glucose phosphotransferase
MHSGACSSQRAWTAACAVKGVSSSMSAIAESERSAKNIPFPFAVLPKVPFTWVRPAVAFADALITVAASLFSGLVYYHFGTDGSDYFEAPLAVGLVVVVYFLTLNGYRRNYATDALSDTYRQVREVSVIWCLVFALLAAAAFLLKIDAHFSHSIASTFFAMGWALLILSRLFLAKILVLARAGGAFAEQKILIIADPQLLATSNCVDNLQRYGYRPAKVIYLTEEPDSELIAGVIAATGRYPEIDSIVIIAGWDRTERIDRLVDGISILHLPIRLVPDPRVAHYLDKRGIQLGTTWTKELRRRPLNVGERAAKRAIDLIFAVCAGILLLPFMLIIACIIKLDSPGPVLFTQARNGFNNRTFRILKFRTLNTIEDGPTIKQVTRNDDRVTRIGKLLRRTSIDELPQLWNVIWGDMSLVGPRPHAAAHNSEYGDLIANYAFRHHVKPGLTGWAQVKGFRGETATIDSMKGRVELDLWYIDNWKLWMDLKIIAKTFAIVLVQRSAY